MGSGTNRKKSDAPIIRTPKASGNTGGGGYNKSPDEIANVCISSFQIEIIKHPTLKESMPAIMVKNKNDIFEVFVSNKKVGILSKNRSEMVDRCQEMGVKYSGILVESGKGDNKKLYARFQR